MKYAERRGLKDASKVAKRGLVLGTGATNHSSGEDSIVLSSEISVR